MELIRTLNAKKDINGILVQSPLPKGLDEEAVVEAIIPRKMWMRSILPMLAAS